MRYFLSQDNSAHWYVVPVDRQRDWEKWLDLPDSDEAAWEAPDYAKPVNGAASRVTFTAPVIE